MDCKNVDRLTPRQQALLDLLESRAGQTVTRKDLMLHISGAWPWESSVSRALDMQICRLRKHLGSEAWRIENVFGVGFKYCNGDQAGDGATSFGNH